MDLFEIIGPVMIGPSSSHTAGAARIGKVARQLLGSRVKRAEIGLGGSFAKTWKGHGTDRAIIGGLLGMEVDDERLRFSLRLARLAGLAYEFREVSLRGAHPNTAVIEAWGPDGEHVCVTAASVGGGSILIRELDGMEVDFTGEQDTLIVLHRDVPGVIAAVTGKIAEAGLNVAAMRVFRTEAGGDAVMVLELDALPEQETVDALRKVPEIGKVTLLARR